MAGEVISRMSFYRTRSFLQRERIPVTIALIAVSTILFLVDFFTRGGLFGLFVYHVINGRLVSPIWTPLVYPLFSSDILTVLFSLLSLWWVGGSLERSWGTARYSLFFVGVSLFGALLVWAGSLILRSQGALMGMWPTLASLTAAWASINPDEQVTFNFIFKLRSRWLAVIIVGITFFFNFAGQPLIGLFWLLCPIAAWYYVRMGFSVGRPLLNRRPPPRGPDLRFSDSRRGPEERAGKGGPLGWYRNWQEQRHLRKLWRNSGFSDKDDPPRR